MDKADAKMAPTCGVCGIGIGTDFSFADVQSNLAILVGGFTRYMVDGAILGQGIPDAHQLVRKETSVDGCSYIDWIDYGDVLFVAAVSMVATLRILTVRTVVLIL